MKFLLIQIALLIFLHSAVKSQTNSSIIIVPDRPGMVTPPTILSIGNLQIEEGSQYEKYRYGLTNNDNFYFITPLLRYGLTRNSEVRIQTDYVYNRKNNGTIVSTTKGLDPITIGSKIKLAEQKKMLPNISLLVNLTLPYLGKKELRPDHLAPSLFVLMSNAISDKLNLCYNYGLSWNGSSSAPTVPTHFYALSLGISLNQKLSTYIENFGYFNKYADPSYFIDAGIAYLINDHVQIDFSATGNLNSDIENYRLNFGIAWLILHRK